MSISIKDNVIFKASYFNARPLSVYMLGKYGNVSVLLLYLEKLRFMAVNTLAKVIYSESAEK